MLKRPQWQTINEFTSPAKSGEKLVTSLKVNGVSITNPTALSAIIGPKFASNVDSSNSDGYQNYPLAQINGFSSIQPVQTKFFHFCII